MTSKIKMTSNMKTTSKVKMTNHHHPPVTLVPELSARGADVLMGTTHNVVFA